MKPLFVLLALVLSGGVMFGAAAAQRPNIVILYADDMGYGDLAANNPEARRASASGISAGTGR